MDAREGDDAAGGTERLVFFSDAVVAIAITLLALPLAEVPRNEETGVAVHPLGEQLALSLGPLLGAALSFFVIARLWWAHHQLFARVRRFSTPLVVANTIWLFTIVLVSSATALVPDYSPVEQPVVVLVYTATVTLSAAALTAVAWIVHRTPGLSVESRSGTLDRVIGAGFTAATFAVAAVVGTLVPVVGYFAIWLLVPSGLLEGAVKRRVRARS